MRQRGCAYGQRGRNGTQAVGDQIGASRNGLQRVVARLVGARDGAEQRSV